MFRPFRAVEGKWANMDQDFSICELKTDMDKWFFFCPFRAEWKGVPFGAKMKNGF
jgi:hypothetical protein